MGTVTGASRSQTSAPPGERLAEAERQIERLRAELIAERNRRLLLQAAHAELLAHDRASVLADWRGESRPTRYSEGHLEEVGLLPSRDSTPDQVVAEGLALALRIGGDQ